MVFGKASGFGTTVNTGGFDRQVIDLTTLSAADGFIIQGDAAGDSAGSSVSVGGRRQRRRLRRPDRRGASRGDDGGDDAGEAYVVFGKASGFGATVNTGGFDRQVIDLTTLSAADGFIIQGDAAERPCRLQRLVGGRCERRRLRRSDRRRARRRRRRHRCRRGLCGVRQGVGLRHHGQYRRVRPAGDRPHDALGRRRLHHPGRYGGRPGRLQRLRRRAT